MNRINRKLEYALIAVKHMATKSQGDLTAVKEISARYGCPFDATSRVLQALVNKGILKSEHGAHGGYLIAKDLSRVSVYEFIEAILGPVEISKCLHTSDGPCEIQGTCNIVSPIVSLNRRLIDFYREISIRELLYPKSVPPPAVETASLDGRMW
jgi:Rrf2 family protein